MSKRTKQITYSGLMCALLIVSTLWFKFFIPGTGVLFTTQVLFVLLCGQILSPIDCLVSVGLYLALGLMGLPVFSATQGIAVLATPSFGYLLSFPFAAAVTSWALQKLPTKKYGRTIASMLGTVVVYLIALPYVALLNALYLQHPVSFSVLIGSYCLAFFPMDIVKGLLAAFLGSQLAKAKI